MGDGNIQYDKSTPVFRINGFTTPEYLHYLDTVFGVLSRGVSEDKDSQESYENAGFDYKTSSDNYSDKFSWAMRSHPELEKFAEWYDSGNKVWPHNIEITPIVLRHLYVTDGSRYGKRCRITASNEFGNESKIRHYFDKTGLPVPKFQYEERSDGSKKMSIVWNVEESKTIYKYMGRPVPGFRYKWPDYSEL